MIEYNQKKYPDLVCNFLFNLPGIFLFLKETNEDLNDYCEKSYKWKNLLEGELSDDENEYNDSFEYTDEMNNPNKENKFKKMRSEEIESKSKICVKSNKIFSVNQINSKKSKKALRKKTFKSNRKNIFKIKKIQLLLRNLTKMKTFMSIQNFLKKSKKF